MILSDETMTKFEFRGDSFPFRCGLLVLEKIQDKVGDIQIAGIRNQGILQAVNGTDGYTTIR